MDFAPRAFVNHIILVSVFMLACVSCHSGPSIAPTTAPTAVSENKAPASPALSAPNLEVKIITSANDKDAKPSVAAQPLVALGDNHSPRFSPSGKRLLYTSRARSTHPQAQVYALDLDTMNERRLTFHDGSDFTPVWQSENAFYFASSTDEIKEAQAITSLMRTYYPEGLKDDEKKNPPKSDGDLTEVYLQSFDGRKIDRVTRSRGFDGEEDFEPKSKKLVFSSARTQGIPHLFLEQGTRVSSVTSAPSIDHNPRLSPDGKSIVWMRTTPSAISSSPQSVNDIALIEIAKRSAPLSLVADTAASGQNVEPSWHPSGDVVIFASNRGAGHFNLYTVSRDGTCTKQLTDSNFDLREPVFRPDGKQIAFTSEKNGQSRIYLMEYHPPTECLLAAPVNSH